MDQSAPPDYSVYANFFGKKVSTFAGPAKIALKNNTELIFGSPYRNKNFNYIIKLDKITYDDLKGGATDENVTILTTRINAKLENAIRECPEQWLWVHRRFKHIQE
jgi:Kdo2-lipid IVA lauroyltransferase/acyltransferase